MMNRFKDAVVIITGGASGIGASLASQLNAVGARIIVADRSVAPENVSYQYYQVDMTDEKAVEGLFNFVDEKYGRIDYIFNNAGIFMAGEIRDTPLENCHKVIENNIWAVSNGAHYAYQYMLKQGSGHIINVSSAAGLFPVPIMGIYGASKFAILGMTHALRNEAKHFGINVSAVCPTIVNTPLYDTAIYNKLNKAKALEKREKVQSPEVAAKRIIKGVMKNKATIHTAFSTRMGRWVYATLPAVYNYFAQRAISAYRTSLRTEK